MSYEFIIYLKSDKPWIVEFDKSEVKNNKIYFYYKNDLMGAVDFNDLIKIEPNY
jgi:hypothetical protein